MTSSELVTKLSERMPHLKVAEVEVIEQEGRSSFILLRRD